MFELKIQLITYYCNVRELMPILLVFLIENDFRPTVFIIIFQYFDRLNMEDDLTQLDQVHNGMLWARRVQLLFSSLILFSMIANIICKKLYVYNTTKMFMWCCICYFIGMAIVLSYTNGIAANNKYTYNESDKKSIIDVLEQMGISKRYCCGAQAFINLYFYDLGYFFAVLVTYNVFCVIKGNYRNFMKGVLRNKKIIGFLIFMLIMHSLPFIFIPIQQQNKNLYSYGPTGVKWLDEQNRTANLLLYCGVSFSSNNEYRYLIAVGLINMYICPLIMLIAHSILLWQNGKKIKIIKQQNYLNSKQQFIIVSGQISFIVFLIQFLNLGKLLLSFISAESNLYYWFIVIINFAFDLYPLLLLFFYLRYTKEKRGLQHGSSTILQQSFEEQ